MKAIAKITVAVLMLGTLVLESCKKGEGDPALSLRSRKARMAGTWNVTSGKGSNTSGSTTTTWVYENGVQTTTYPSPLPAGTDKFTQKYVIEKDGTFTMTLTDTDTNPDPVETYTGTWNFTGGVGEEKNKSSVIFNVLTYSDGTTTVTYTGDDAMTMMMDIYQLKNKEIIVKNAGTTSLPASSNESEWTWTAE
jgi:hypothetical protein